MEERNSELQHYGVVGMKWGVRRANKKGTTYTYKSHGTKKYARKAKKHESKGNTEKAAKYKNYHKRSVELDRKMQKNAESNGPAKVAAKVGLQVLSGVAGGRTYEVTRAATGESKYVSRGAALVNAYMTGMIGATPVRALYVRGHLGKEK